MPLLRLLCHREERSDVAIQLARSGCQSELDCLPPELACEFFMTLSDEIVPQCFYP